MFNPFVRPYSPPKPSGSSEDVREIDIVWTWVSDSTFKCAECGHCGGIGDTVHAVTYRDSEGRRVLCVKCYEEAEDAA